MGEYQEVQKVKEKESIGVGLWIITILTMIVSVFTVLAAPWNYLSMEHTNQFIENAGNPELKSTTASITIGLIISIILIVAIILIWCKRNIGVYIYIGISIINMIYPIIRLGFSLLMLGSIALSVGYLALFIFFAHKKKEVFR